MLALEQKALQREKPQKNSISKSATFGLQGLVEPRAVPCETLLKDFSRLEDQPLKKLVLTEIRRVS